MCLKCALNVLYGVFCLFFVRFLFVFCNGPAPFRSTNQRRGRFSYIIFVIFPPFSFFVCSKMTFFPAFFRLSFRLSFLPSAHGGPLFLPFTTSPSRAFSLVSLVCIPSHTSLPRGHCAFHFRAVLAIIKRRL